MFHRPWRIWFFYILCLAIIFPAMVFVTTKAFQLEDSWRSELEKNETARREAEMQELVSSALWRMDWILTPLVGEEASRSHQDYVSFFYEPAGKSTVDPSDPQLWEQYSSPIISQPSEFVNLNFEVTPANQWTSPQLPIGEVKLAAIDNGANASQIDGNSILLHDLAATVSPEELIRQLPDQMLPNDLLSDLGSQNVGVNLLNSDNFPNPNWQEESQTSNPPINQVDNPPFVAMNQRLQQQEIPIAIPPSQLEEQVAQSRLGRQQGRSQVKTRGDRDVKSFANRAQISQSSAQAMLFNQKQSQQFMSTSVVQEGVSRPVWMGDKLLLARKTIRNGDVYLQGCWFNWEKIQESLLNQIADLLPGAKLIPVKNEKEVKVGRVLATLPIQLDVSDVQLTDVSLRDDLSTSSNEIKQSMSPIRVALIVAWSCMFFGAVAVALLLQGVVKLSERRASFVSAVTHELRTPLTTFRMYAEMLAKGMVTSDDKRQQYCETLQDEADRLSHLVENVLQFARLEHGKSTNTYEVVRIGELVDRFQIRFEERVAQANMTLSIEVDEETRQARLKTDPAAIEHVLFNLIDNACKYAWQAEDKQIKLEAIDRNGHIEFRVSDHGPGVAENQRRRIFRPFSKSAQDAAKSAPGVGLGLALCQRLSKQLGGKLFIEKSNRSGTTFLFTAPHSS